MKKVAILAHDACSLEELQMQLSGRYEVIEARDIDHLRRLLTSGEATTVVHVLEGARQSADFLRKLEFVCAAGRAMAAVAPGKIARMSSSERTRFISRRIVSGTREAFGFDYFAVLKIADDTGALMVFASEGLQAADVDALGLHVAAEGGGIAGRVAHTGRPYQCKDIAADPLYIAAGRENRSLMAVPVKLDGKALGVFNVESDRPNAFNNDDLKLLAVFADYVALAMNTATLSDTIHLAVQKELTTTMARRVNVVSRAMSGNVGQLVREYIGQDVNTTNRLNRVLSDIERIRTIISGVEKPGEEPPAPPQQVDPELAGRRILVADDDPGIRQSMRAILSGEGCVVDVACDGEEALKQVAGNPPDLVLCDIRMPKKNGYELFSEMRALHPNLPVILMTAFGYDPSHSIVKARSQGLETVLFKPFKVDKLRREIKKAIKMTSSGKGAL